MLRRTSLCTLIFCCLSNLTFAGGIIQREPQSSDPQSKPSLYRVCGLAEKTLALKDVTAKTMGAALIAGALWREDETYARQLFQKALAFTTVSDTENQTLLSGLRQKVLVLVAKHDALWAKRLIDSSGGSSSESLSQRRETNIETARGLINVEPDTAIDFALRSLQGGVSDSFIWFLKELKKSNETAANKLFLQCLMLLARQPVTDVSQFTSLGTYIFTSPKLEGDDSTNLIFTRVGDIGIIDITAERPGTQPALVRAYLEAALEVLTRAMSSPDQQQPSYALGDLLLPKARKFAPDLVAPIGAAMSALSGSIPANITQESAYANINKVTFDSVEEMISRAEKLAGSENRDVAFLDIALAIVASLRNSNQSKETVVRVGEDGMRKSAAKTVMPVYPEEAVKRGEKGVVIIEVQYNGKGVVTGTRVLETPSLSISGAVVSAVKQWRFIPSTLKGKPISVRGKLTFYFNIDENGQGRVDNPKQYQ
ncbi:MAG: energy transducer TonB [Pyrinomonadaceae bacterium]|nr:energy transducer TonB [Pyrinomonadaceae bacterium]